MCRSRGDLKSAAGGFHCTCRVAKPAKRCYNTEKMTKEPVRMDIWQTLYEKAKQEYHPEDVTPFVYAHHVVCALESESGAIFTGFCIEACSGVMNLCAERVAALNMYVNSGQTVVKRLIAFRDTPPSGTHRPPAAAAGCPAARAGSFSCSCPRKTAIWRSSSTTKRAKPSDWQSSCPTGGAKHVTARRKKYSGENHPIRGGFLPFSHPLPDAEIPEPTCRAFRNSL